MMNEDQIKEELDSEPFRPIRLHLVSGKTIDVLRANAAMTLRDRLLVFQKLAKSGHGADGYDIIAYNNIERIEQLDIGKRLSGRGRSVS